MTDREILQAMAEMIQPIHTKIGKIEEHLGSLEKETGKIEERLGSLEKETEKIKEQQKDIDRKVDKNYGLLEQFYVEQKERDTKTNEKIAFIQADLEMQRNQINMNTATIRRY
ncbi:MAG: hypothetical protein MR543_10170 [Robinsoniella sp.]|nr:hypothetical protein [Robinsoniella sp.]